MATEKWLIDANELLLNIRAKLVKAKCEYRRNEIISIMMDGFDALVLSEIKRAESIEAVEVVRCKDCRCNGECSIQDAMNWTPNDKSCVFWTLD